MRVKDLKPNPKNPRTITDAKLAQLRKALLEFGDLSGIVYNRQTDQLVGGHQRAKVFEGGTVVIEHKFKKPTQVGTVATGYIMTDGERYSYREVSWPKAKEMAANLAANKGAGEWDLPVVGEMLKELGSFDVDFDLDLTMFDADELKEFGVIDVAAHTRVGATGVDEDDVPEKAPPRTKLGDIYRLGEHRVMCGDSTDSKHVARLMKGQRAHMVFTDPPYNTGMAPQAGQRPPRNGSAWLSHFFNDDFTPEQWDAFLDAFLDAFHANTQDHAAVYICLDWRRSGELVAKAKKRFKFSNLIVWDKMVHGLGADYKYTHEFIHVFKKGKPELDTHQGEREYSDVWHVQRKMGRDDEHATKKPVELVERPISHASKPGQLVLDLFGGAGSTLIACEKLGRASRIMEIDPSYCDVIVERWEKYTGRKAQRVASAKDGKPILKKKTAAQSESSRA